MVRIRLSRRAYSIRCMLGQMLLVMMCLHLSFHAAQAETIAAPRHAFESTIAYFASLEDRSTGTPGCKAAADYIRQCFRDLGIEKAGSQRFFVPVRRHVRSTLTLLTSKETFAIHPLLLNAISPATIPPQGLEGPLIYVGNGDLKRFNGKTVVGAVVLMDLDSAENWVHAASLGAKALIYVDRGASSKFAFEEKYELSPIDFPRFRMPLSEARKVFKNFETAFTGQAASPVRLVSNISWQEAECENIYALIPGVDPKLREELIVVDAFYDSTPIVSGKSPGADEACGVAALLELAAYLKRHPSGRSVLLVATGGHAQTLAGMREMVWSIRTSSRELRKQQKTLRSVRRKSAQMLKILSRAALPEALSPEEGLLLQQALNDRIKTEVDFVSKQLMALRLKQDGGSREAIQQLARQRLMLRQLGWRSTFADLSDAERAVVERLIPSAVKEHRAVLNDAKRQLETIKSGRSLRSLVKSYELAALISLHLSSHGDGFGAFNQGWLYPLKANINRVAAYSKLVEAIEQAAKTLAATGNRLSLLKDSLRPSRRYPWQSYFLDRPPLGGEVSALAGYLGVSLVSLHDARGRWGTPDDIPQNMNMAYAFRQALQVCRLVQQLTHEPRLQSGKLPRDGFSTVSGHAKLLRHGELFADRAAAGTMILAYQGPARYHAMVDALGNFYLKGLASKKLVLDKVIIEGFRFDPQSGRVIWAIDKKQTGKPAYRLKMQRRSMETDLIMFACRQTTLFNLLEPRNFNYMTRIQLIDGRREASPVRYWYSRIDTRASVINSVYLEPGTPLKLTLSDSILRKKMILTHATPEHSQGKGYRVDDWPLISHTTLRTARDMWALLAPRIANLENHGIFNARIRNLQQEGLSALKAAEEALKAEKYDRFEQNASKSWALASRVYDDVEETQKDVLFGVLFYIALFVPFAFCMERLLCGYTDIHKRIIAFTAILMALIAVIYKVHPAFELAYSPTVVILAFFIMGLSLVVTLIIFFRFEEEMILLQRRAQHIRAAEISRWKAFAGAFFLGVTNLRRRRLRTVLTCMTLVILTFTIMSFTTVKSMRSQTRLLYQPHSPYQGFLFKNINWKSLPPEAAGSLSNTFEGQGVAAPRAWLENPDRTRSLQLPVRLQAAGYEARAVLGLSAREAEISGLDRLLTGGRWFAAEDRQAVLLPERIAAALGIDPLRPRGAVVTLWGMPFDVVGTFSGEKLQNFNDLDGEPLTPVTFPGEVTMEITEVEMEAIESGEDVRAFQSRYQHIAADLTIILPYETVMALGGELKSVAVNPAAGVKRRVKALELIDRFGIPLFSGEKDGTFLYTASDTLSYSGVPNIVVPLIISILIVLNTMIGSVYERKREIAVYTSVGLAPSHVSFIFVAEALAFAVLSVVLGYLLAQVSAGIFAGTPLWAGITVNYSSLAGVAAMILVILVVLISVIYPSKVAARIAIPDVSRSWRLPAAEENRLEVTLPFLMRYSELESLGGFLFNYFKEHQDVSHGIFSTSGTGFVFVCPTLGGIAEGPQGCVGPSCCKEPCLQLNAKVWLAPFDFGIMQRVNAKFCPALEEPGFLEINMLLQREAGEAATWERINRTFLLRVRKQLLVWRSLDYAAHEHFRKVIAAERQKSEWGLRKEKRS